MYTHGCVYPCVNLYISIFICEDLEMLKHTWFLVQMFMWAWDMCIHMCTWIWTNTALNTHIRAYEWTHAMLMYISTFTYIHVPRCICWHKHNRCVHMHIYMKIFMFCTYVCDLSICTYICEHAHMCAHLYFCSHIWFNMIQTIYWLVF